MTRLLVNATRSVAVTGLTLLATLAWCRPASAASPDAYGWWSQTGTVAQPAPPENGLFIANKASGPDAISALAFSVPQDTEKATLTVTISGTAVMTTAPTVCLATSLILSAQNGAWDKAPTYDCSFQVTGVADSAGTLVTFAAGSLIRDGRLSVVLLAGGPLDRLSFNRPDDASLRLARGSSTPSPAVAPTQPLADPGIAPSQPAPGQMATLPAGPPLLAPTNETQPTQNTPPKVASSLAPTQPNITNAATTRVTGGGRRRTVGAGLGVALILAVVTYWADGFGALRLRSAMARLSA